MAAQAEEKISLLFQFKDPLAVIYETTIKFSVFSMNFYRELQWVTQLSYTGYV